MRYDLCKASSHLEACIPRRRPAPRIDLETLAAAEPQRDGNGRGAHHTKPRQERAYLVGLEHGPRGLMSAEESLREFGRLVRTAGAAA
jgi:hypothetical protein